MNILKIKDQNELIEYIKSNIKENNEIFKEEIIKYISIKEDINFLSEIENLIEYLNKIEIIDACQFIKEDKYNKESFIKNMIYDKIIEGIKLNDIPTAEKIIIEIGNKKNKDIYELQKNIYKKILKRFDEIQSFYVIGLIKENFDERIIAEINLNEMPYNKKNMTEFNNSFVVDKTEGFDLKYIYKIKNTANLYFKQFKLSEKNSLFNLLCGVVLNEKGEKKESQYSEYYIINLIYSERFNYNPNKFIVEDFDNLKISSYGNCSFLEYNINIYNFMKEEKFYLALKESILFLESLLRFIVYKSDKKKIFEYKKSQLNEKIFYIKDFCNKYSIDKKHFLEYEKELSDKLMENEVINGMLLNDLINSIYEMKIIENETKDLLKYFLLNNNNNGLNLRNEIFHGLRNEKYIIEPIIYSSFMYIYSVILELLNYCNSIEN